jgi:hypothetical protein
MRTSTNGLWTYKPRGQLLLHQHPQRLIQPKPSRSKKGAPDARNKAINVTPAMFTLTAEN